MTTDESQFLKHGPCEACGSSDANAFYSNGTQYCFACSKWAKDDDAVLTTPIRKGTTMSLLSYEYQSLGKRKIPDNITRQYRYGFGTDASGVLCHVANYFNDAKEIVAQKLRYPDKTFKFIGDTKEATLFGQQLWGGTGKKVVITEGELDALSVATAFDGKYPVVSLKGGSNSAKKEIAQQLKWITGHEEIYLWFDNDEAGRQAVVECVNILPADKVRIIRHADHKDASDVLVYKGKAGVVNAFYNAEKYQPDDIVRPLDLIESVAEPIEMGFSYCYSKLTDMLYGRRFGEVVVVGAGVSVGKTDFVMSQLAHDLKQGWKVATFMLEQSTKETLLRAAGKIDGCHYHLPNVEHNKEQIIKTVTSFQGDLYMFDNFGSNDWTTISDKIRYMFHNYGCRIVYIDNLTALNAHASDERRNLDGLMAEVAGIAKELDIWVMLVSHLNPPKSGVSHEAGGQTEQGQFTGSRAIMRWAYSMFGIERNTLHDDPIERNRGLIRVLKDRFSGSATGHTVGFLYDKDTGIVHQMDEDFEIAQTEATDEGDF
jgi:twinkle protein|tara:strand:- start:8735 stop:10360 length:1626 start_codon:yes stop_codon:yes gene_type:complete